MAEPSTTAAGTAIAAGLTIFGVTTGLDPAVLIAGLAGGLLAQSYRPAVSIWHRLPLSCLAAILAGYFAPAVAAVAVSSETVRGTIPFMTVQLCAAVIVGLTVHQVLGPALMRFVSKKAEECAK